MGLNLGIDFEGGTKITATVPDGQPVSVEDVRAEAAKLGQEGAQIVGRGDAADRYPGFQIQTEELPPIESRNLTQSLDRAFDADTSVQTVSASFGRQIAEGAILAIIVSLLLITIYIAFRFQAKFAGR